jgi:hypothetical protein
VRRSAYLPGQVLAEVAVMIADEGEAIADLAVLRNWLLSPHRHRATGTPKPAQARSAVGRE